ncbi:peptidase C25 [Flavobacterium sp. SOK18b]|uniref:type IX secretion system sortase PorU n=1 Tax=Flavobacterium sp. SOK18b TaxID=797900 RepID=UPI0015FB8D27|nr:type IX secretion system sortase PorU [Flavobacterium sp. SOK18b]MBB1192301.1 peptidase C25 [Flavobacterium sp. SOK18b]
MRKIILFFLAFIPALSFSQLSGEIKLNWFEKKEMYYGANQIVIPYFSGDEFHYDDSRQTIKAYYVIPNYRGFQDGNLQVSSIVYEPIDKELLGDLNLKNIPTEADFDLVLSTARDLVTAQIIFAPIIKDDFGFKKIISFNYFITANTSVTNRSFKSTAGISNSLLSKGNWYKFYIEKSGVYKLSKRFLEQLGIDFKNVDARKIKIFGNGGRMLPLSNNIAYPNDLMENTIQVIGENDSTFDDSDYVLFYGEGTDTWNEESRTNINLYDSKSYYYVNIQGENGKRISPLVQPTANPTLLLNTFDDYQFYEKDITNIGKLGRQWFGESFEIKNEQEFDFNFPNVDTSVPIKIMLSAASAAFTATSFSVTSNGSALATLTFPALSNTSSTEFFVSNLPNNTTINGSENVKIKLNYNNNGVPGSKGFLDQIRLIAKRKLQGYGKQFRFQNDAGNAANGIVNYTVSNAAGISQIWDVTDIYNVKTVVNSSQNTIDFKANLGEIKKYVALVDADFFTPLKDAQTRVSNQNLKGTLFTNRAGNFQDIDYVIISPTVLVPQAETLANFHRINSGLNVKVIPLELIYNEFSSGKQDIAAIRNCIKYIYQNASSPDKRLKYINLFGDSSYDYKNRIANNTNVVPIYHALNSSSSGESSYASDDFYGLMDANEGNITSSFGGIDIAVGRMLVNDAKQANEMINKVLEYHNSESFGSWRNNFVLISDDSDVLSDANLQNKQNNLANTIATEKPFFNVNKILLDSYIQEAAAGGARYPKARTDFFNAFEKGALVFNYLGHGGEDGLSVERIWEKSDGQNLSNQFKYPLFITITCEFSRFDNPSRPTAGEFTYWNPKGGAIAMITTIRSIGQFSAETFNDTFTKNLLSYGSNQYTSIAEALRISKNSNPNSATNVVFYIGDPALKLAIPRPKIRLTKINDVPVSQAIEDFKSLSKIKITGEVSDENNNIISNYNGEVTSMIFDKMLNRTTLNNDGNSPPINFNVLGETIFRGSASVVNGQFEYSFIVPRDIRIPLANGRISFYAKKKDALQNENGFDSNIKIGGINENAPLDTTSPRVQLYMNDENFVSGGNTNESPFLLAKLSDESGINTASGIGHDIVAVLDGDVNNPFVLNDYYQADLDDFTNGTLRFPLRNLAPGLHIISFKAWDVYNNPITAEIQFVVVGNDTLTLSNVLNYPNPFVNYTEFWFTHNKPFEPLEVQVQVMTVTGKIVWTKNQIITTDGFLSKELTWNGRDDFGDKLGKGVYVYKLTVKSNATNKKAEKFEKLVIL